MRYTTTDWMLQLANTHKTEKYSISKESNKFTKLLDFTPKERHKSNKGYKKKKNKERSKNTKSKFFLKNAKEQKPVDGRYAQRMKNADIDIVNANQLKAKWEELIVFAQDQNLPARNYQKNIKSRSNLIYRLCDQTESIDHLVSGFPILILIKYKEKNDDEGHNIHWKIC